MDGLGAYLHASGEKPLLSPTSERRLARRARAGSKRARDELVERNLRLVIPTAKKFRGQGLSFEGLIGEGNAGLIKAADKFDPEMGYRFSTYATWWIHQSVSRALAHTGATIRIPVHVGEHRHRIYKAVRDFEREHAREPSRDELEGLTGLESVVIHWAQSVPERQATLEAPIRGEEPEGSTMGSVIPDAD